MKLQRIDLVREVDRADRLIEELGAHIAYGAGPSEELAGELGGYDSLKAALDDLYERRQKFTELLSKNPDQDEFDV